MGLFFYTLHCTPYTKIFDFSCICRKKVVLLQSQKFLYGITVIVFIRCDGYQFSVLRVGVGADVDVA